MRRTRARRATAAVATAMVGISFAATAHATHILGGSISYRIPDPAAPLAVELTVTLAHRTAFPVEEVTIDFDDGTSATNSNGSVVGVIGGAGGQTLTRFVLPHTYPASGVCQPHMNTCCYGANTVNDPSGSISLQSKVVLGTGGRGGPVAPLMPFIPMQTGGLRTFEIPMADHDGSPITCAHSLLVPMPVIPGGAPPTIGASPNGCLITWNTAGAVAGQSYRFELELDDGANLPARSLSFIDSRVPVLPGRPGAVQRDRRRSGDGDVRRRARAPV